MCAYVRLASGVYATVAVKGVCFAGRVMAGGRGVGVVFWQLEVVLIKDTRKAKRSTTPIQN